MTLTLTKEIEQGLAEEAQRQGVAPEQLVLATLQERFAAPDTKHENVPEGSAYDLFEGLIGRIHSGGGHWSEDTGAKFADGMEEKRRQGHL